MDPDCGSIDAIVTNCTSTKFEDEECSSGLGRRAAQMHESHQTLKDLPKHRDVMTEKCVCEPNIPK